MILPVHHPAVILLAFVLALGFLLVILSCALWANWLPLLVGKSTPSRLCLFLRKFFHALNLTMPIRLALTFVLAPVPNSICSRCARADDLSPEYNSAYVDFGRFLTGMLVVRLISPLPLLVQAKILMMDPRRQPDSPFPYLWLTPL